MAAHKNVMISSTVRDLPKHREEVLAACLSLDMFPKMMEYLPASDADGIRVSLDMVDDADIYVGVFAQRYGHIPSGSKISITEMEYNRAVERNIPRLIFLMADEHAITIGDVEVDQADKLKALKDRLKREKSINFFHSPEDLRQT